MVIAHMFDNSDQELGGLLVVCEPLFGFQCCYSI